MDGPTTKGSNYGDDLEERLHGSPSVQPARLLLLVRDPGSS